MDRLPTKAHFTKGHIQLQFVLNSGAPDADSGKTNLQWLRDGWGQEPAPFDLLVQEPLFGRDFPDSEEGLDSLTQYKQTPGIDENEVGVEAICSGYQVIERQILEELVSPHHLIPSNQRAKILSTADCP